MAIEEIKVSNFKSFDDLTVELGNLTVLIGANASGKSNFLELFRFLRDVTTAEDSLQDAISRQGGVDYFRNINLGVDKDFQIGVKYVANREKWNPPVFVNKQVRPSIFRYYYSDIYKSSLVCKKSTILKIIFQLLFFPMAQLIW